MNTSSFSFWAATIGDVIYELVRARLWSGISCKVSAPEKIPSDFIGVNVAPSSDAECDDYIIDRLSELSIGHVRMDFSYCSLNGDAERLLQRLLAEGIDVFLNVFPHGKQVSKIAEDPAAQNEWREFVATVISRYHKKVSVFELANTPNRGKWSGVGVGGFLTVWQIANEEARKFDLTLAGPNISDFEPVFNLFALSVFKRYSRVPQIHTDNLFVERVVEPEAYDRRVLGRWFERRLALNLVKKARVLQDIGRRFGAEKTICTYTLWTGKRLARKAVNPEEKRADYLVRYLILAAASEALERVYWGPLICSRDGLIDCGTEGYPKVDNVSFHKAIRGNKKDFSVYPVFHALRQVKEVLSDSRCEQAVSAINGINHFVFTRDGKEIHAVWCRDSHALPLTAVYGEGTLEKLHVDAVTVTGELLDSIPASISEQPFFLNFDGDAVSARPDPKTLEAIKVSSDITHVSDEFESVPVEYPEWRGMLKLPRGDSLSQVKEKLDIENLLKLDTNKVLRDTRNKLWAVDDPVNPGEQLAIKLNRAKGMKRFSYRFTASKGKRHWDNASFMLRRGISTPEPLAYFERYSNSGIRENYYICRFIDNNFSARDVFACFKRGESHFREFSKEQMLNNISRFVCEMHFKRIVHRDLSSGNIMMAMNENGGIDMFMIDIGRARISFKHKLPPRQRFKDLQRICYKLSWPDRELFMEYYNRHHGGVVSRWWRWPLFMYEFKQSFKKTIRGKKKRKKKRS